MSITTITDSEFPTPGGDFTKESHELPIAKILLLDENLGKYQKNRSYSNWNALVIALIKTIGTHEEINGELSKKLTHLISKIFAQSLNNHHNNLFYSNYINPEQLIYNKFYEWLMMNYIWNTLEQENPNQKITITQSSLKQDLKDGYDYIVHSDKISYKVDLKIRAKSNQSIVRNANINYIILTPEEFNTIISQTSILLRYITLEHIEDIDQLNTICKEYFSTISPKRNHLQQYQIKLRKQPKHQKRKHNSRSNGFLKSTIS